MPTMKKIRFEDIAYSKTEDFALCEISLTFEKLHLIPSWVTEELSVDPNFGAYPEYAAA